jgi:RNA polymerase sigma-70 factor (ECF subfamily)
MSGNVQQTRDEWIALRCQCGEAEAFAELVRAMERPLLYYAHKLVNDQDKALDVLQEVWLKAFQGIGRLDKPGAVRAWLYKLTRGLAVDRVRKDSAAERRERLHAEERADTGPDPSFDGEEVSAVHRALDEIDIRHREVLVLHFLEEMTVTEVAAVLGCPAGTVKSRLHHAKRALQAVLQRGQHGQQG